jgi:putative Holliday junction resolvase
LTGIANDGAGPRWEAFDSLMRDWLPSLLVVGLPYHVDGSEGAASRAVHRFAAGLADRYGVPVRLVDERYSSLEGASRLRSERARGLRKRRVGKADIDAAAACVILERWFSDPGSTMPIRAPR